MYVYVYKQNHQQLEECFFIITLKNINHLESAEAIWAAKRAPWLSGCVFIHLRCFAVAPLTVWQLAAWFLLHCHPFFFFPLPVAMSICSSRSALMCCFDLCLRQSLFSFCWFFLFFLPFFHFSSGGRSFSPSFTGLVSLSLSLFFRSFWSVLASIFMLISFCLHLNPLCRHATLSCDCVAVRTVYFRLLRLRLRLEERRRRPLRAIFLRFFCFLRGFGSFSFLFLFPSAFFHLTSAKWLTVAFHRKCMFGNLWSFPCFDRSFFNVCISSTMSFDRTCWVTLRNGWIKLGCLGALMEQMMQFSHSQPPLASQVDKSTQV